MKLDLQELYVCKTAIESQTIKAVDAPIISTLITKLDKEFVRLQAIEEKKSKEAAKIQSVAK